MICLRKSRPPFAIWCCCSARKGVTLPYPYSSKISQKNVAGLRELRVQHEGRPYRVLYAFDPRRHAILLISGDKTGNQRWYDINVPLAERIYQQYLKETEQE